MKSAIYQIAGRPDMAECESASAETLKVLSRAKSDALSGLNIVLEGRKDAFLSSLIEQVQGVRIANAQELSRTFVGGAQFMTQDTRALHLTSLSSQRPSLSINLQNVANNLPRLFGKLAHILCGRGGKRASLHSLVQTSLSATVARRCGANSRILLKAVFICLLTNSTVCPSPG